MQVAEKKHLVIIIMNSAQAVTALAYQNKSKFVFGSCRSLGYRLAKERSKGHGILSRFLLKILVINYQLEK